MTKEYPKNPPQLGEVPHWPLGPVDFSSDAYPIAPSGYKCLVCGVGGVRLWREYQCIASAITLHCFDCAILKNGGKLAKPYSFEKGDYTPDDGEIAGLVAAVPTAEGDTFWGYGSLPADGVVWWWGLSPRPGHHWSQEERLRVQRDQWRRCHENAQRMSDYNAKGADGWRQRAMEAEEKLTAAGLMPRD